MKWNKYSLKTTTEAVDLVSNMLMELGIEGIEIEDNVQLSESDIKTMFVDFLPELPPDDGAATVNFYIDSEEDDRTIIPKVKEGLKELAEFINIGEGTIEESETEDKDWINNWKQYFKPFVFEGIVIKPTWEEIDDSMQGKIVVNIDPGTAFGTGSHETTQLVISQLDKYVKDGDELLDVGCGSGILSVIGLMLGAKHAVGTDLDPNAIVATRENAEINNISMDKIEILEGNIIDDKKIKDAVGYERYDVVAANILADVLIPLSSCITDHMKSGAYFITSGIINTKEEEVVEAFRKNPLLEIVEINHKGEWVNVTARKK
ncbi:MAG: 50S ribosomal protein L11 methyltransferase [Thermoflexaceae bacterium]|nr:50S ribosomal protein L11 methyltransferase [Thermoflexaceae bacterium]